MAFRTMQSDSADYSVFKKKSKSREIIKNYFENAFSENNYKENPRSHYM